jgi:hypothetical protein
LDSHGKSERRQTKAVNASGDPKIDATIWNRSHLRMGGGMLHGEGDLAAILKAFRSSRAPDHSKRRNTAPCAGMELLSLLLTMKAIAAARLAGCRLRIEFVSG